MDIARVAEIALGLVLAVAVSGKWLNVRWFFRIVHQYGVLPRWSVPFAALSVMGLESFLAICLLSGAWRPIAAYFSFALISLFVILIVSSLLLGRLARECGCFVTRQAQTIGWGSVLRNTGVLLLAGIAAVNRDPSIRMGTLSIFVAAVILIVIPSLFVPTRSVQRM